MKAMSTARSFEALQLRQVQGGDADGDVLGLGQAGQAQPAGADRLDMRWPGVDEGDVVAEPGEVPADIAADRSGADEDHPGAHRCLLRGIRAGA